MRSQVCGTVQILVKGVQNLDVTVSFLEMCLQDF